tara:strand:+ start:1906 stop:3177 length:1272 start_codon:yes stop_codon:yes gene_type:complete
VLDFKKKFFVYGLGVSGRSVVHFFRNNNIYFKATDDVDLKKKILKGKEKSSKKNINSELIKSDYIVVSPSINIKNHKILLKFKEKIIIDIDIIFSIISKKTKLIGITGTEGKSSVCFFLNNLLNLNYKSVILGNFGNTVLQRKNIIKELIKYDFIIFELSSYQLHKIKFLKLDIATITNLYPDHLNYHKSYKSYIRCKLKISKLLKSNSKLYINHNAKNEIIKNKISLPVNLHLYKNFNFESSIQIPFYKENLSLAFLIASSLKTNIKYKNIKLFKTLPFRFEEIINNKKLKIYNDSKSTNLTNSIISFNKIPKGNKILILGGILKKNTHTLPLLKGNAILIFGKYADIIHDQISKKSINSKIFKFYNLEYLIIFLSFLLKIYNSKVTILFSPGGESFDQYTNFEDRGTHFNKLIRKYIIKYE